MAAEHTAVVVGQIGRDLVLRCAAVPDADGTAPMTGWDELLGGKSANQAVGLRQLGVRVALVGVVGADDIGAAILRQARADGLDVDAVVRRGRTSLFVDIVEDGGTRRVLEGAPAESLLRPQDVRSAADTIAAAQVVVLQAQQPVDALLEAAGIARTQGARVVLDGAVTGPDARELLSLVDAVRADAGEAAALAGHPLPDRAAVEAAAVALRAAGPGVVAFAVAGEGNVVASANGTAFLPELDADVVDVTGGGDSFVAGFVTALLHGADPVAAARAGSHAAAGTVTHAGGRPAFTER